MDSTGRKFIGRIGGETSMLIEGKFENSTAIVIVEGKQLKTTDYYDGVQYTPNWQWGHPGCVFLAWVLLYIATGKVEVANSYCQTFKWSVAQLPFGKPFKTDLDITGWLEEQEQFQDARYSMRN